MYLLVDLVYSKFVFIIDKSNKEEILKNNGVKFVMKCFLRLVLFV